MFLRKFSRDVAIDLGTSNTLVYVRGEGIVVNEPSIVSINEEDHSILAVGNEAKAMIGRTPPEIRVIQPLKNGVIADFEMTERMLTYFISRTQRWLRTILKPQVVIGVPAGITQVERRAVRDSARHAGARDVYLVEEPVAAAIGAGLHGRVTDGALLDLRDPRGHADDDARPDERAAAVHLRDEVVQHLLGHVEVRDDPVLERADRDDVSGSPSEHGLGFVTDREHRMVRLVNRHDRGLVEHDAFAADIDQRVRGSQIDREIVGEHSGQQVVEHRRSII